MGNLPADKARQKFTGYEQDAETGLNFAEARYNSSAQGRFTSADSVGGSIGNPQSLNRYAYVGNNPMNLSDPSGHMPSIHTNSKPTDNGYEGGGYAWDDPNSPQAVLGDLGYTSADIIASTQINDFSTTVSKGDNVGAGSEGKAGGKGDNLVAGNEGKASTGTAQIANINIAEAIFLTVSLIDDEEESSNTVATAVEAALQVLKSGCWTEDQWNQDVKPGTRYFANVENASNYAKNWSSSVSVHSSGVKESPTILTHFIRVVDKNGKTDPFATGLLAGPSAFSFVLKYYPGQGMAVTSNTLSFPHAITTPGYLVGVDRNVNVRWAQMFLAEAPKCKK